MNSPDCHWQEERIAPHLPAPARSRKAEALRRLDLCRHFDGAALPPLALNFTLQTFARRAPIYQAGDERDAVYGLIEGHVKVLGDDREGHRRALLDILPPGTIFGEDALHSGGRRDRTAIAYDNVTAARIPKAEFQLLLAEHPPLYGYVFRLVGERLARAESKVLDLSLDGIARRLAKFLVEMASRYGALQDGGGVLINLKLPHREIAELVGSTRESVTVHLNDLRRGGLIEFSDRKILITDLPSLSAQA